MSGPARVVVEFENGTRREIPFEKLSRQTQAELANEGSGESRQTGNNFILLEWKDGWKEVAAVDGRAAELLRYYTIERMEQVGRLSLEVPGDYPEILLIKRLPSRVQSILFVRDGSVEAYSLEEKVSIKEGDKLERIFYDKKRPNFKAEETSAANGRFELVLSSLKEELKKKGLKSSSIQGMSETERQKVYTDLAHALGLRGNRHQRDVAGFVRLAIQKLDLTP